MMPAYGFCTRQRLMHLARVISSDLSPYGQELPSAHTQPHGPPSVPVPLFAEHISGGVYALLQSGLTSIVRPVAIAMRSARPRKWHSSAKPSNPPISTSSIRWHSQSAGRRGSGSPRRAWLRPASRRSAR
eukprot:scaffold13732_cov147-Isochrysis_galbana.AAC.2